MDAPETPVVPGVAPTPPVSIVVEPPTVLKHLYRQFMFRTPEWTLTSDIFCYDEAVKRSTVEQGVKQGRLLVKHLLPAIWKPIHSLWHEVIAFVFLSLAIWGGFWAVRHLRAFGDTTTDQGKVYLVFAGTAVLLWYGVDGFRRARKISRS
jgi:hypothetical protein